MKVPFLIVSLSLVAFSPSAFAQASSSSAQLWQDWTEDRFVSTPAPCFGPDELNDSLESLVSRYPTGLSIEEVGSSVQGRPIHLMSLGRGDREVLLWSQMHGDEPSATPALLDIADYLLSHRSEPWIDHLLGELTLRLVPMLNPDAAASYRRRNAQAIDVNRDALNLATPEGRLLKRLRDRYQPILGFNLHDQNRRRTVGDTGIPASNALLAVSGDEANTLTPERQLARRVCTAIAEALRPHRPGGMARYDETFSPRSFGDNITAWGTPVVLIESGSVLSGTPFDDLTRLNFVGILSALDALATGRVHDLDPGVYEALPDNNLGPWTDVLLRGGLVWQPGVDRAYRADLGFDRLLTDQQLAGCSPGTPAPSRISEVGDARERVAGIVVDTRGQIVVPLWSAVAEGWKARRWFAELETRRRLLHSGLGHIDWIVPPSKHARAEAWLQTQRAEDPADWPRVQVTSRAPRPDLPRLRPLPTPGDLPDDARLLSRVLALVDTTTAARLEKHNSLAMLFAETGDGSAASLHPGAPASFLLLDPGGEPTETGPLLAPMRLEEVWIDGRRWPGTERGE